jgi:hypothetical protein
MRFLLLSLGVSTLLVFLRPHNTRLLWWRMNVHHRRHHLRLPRREESPDDNSQEEHREQQDGQVRLLQVLPPRQSFGDWHSFLHRSRFPHHRRRRARSHLDLSHRSRRHGLFLRHRHGQNRSENQSEDIHFHKELSRSRDEAFIAQTEAQVTYLGSLKNMCSENLGLATKTPWAPTLPFPFTGRLEVGGTYYPAKYLGIPCTEMKSGCGLAFGPSFWRLTQRVNEENW